MTSKQREYSDKSVYKNIDKQINIMINNEEHQNRSKRKYSFLGIGGIGMSGLAQVMKIMGFNIQGSDQSKNRSTSNCSKAGIKVFIGHFKSNIKCNYNCQIICDKK